MDIELTINFEDETIEATNVDTIEVEIVLALEVNIGIDLFGEQNYPNNL